MQQIFVDLGVSPLANAYLKPEDLNHAEKFYPLKAFVCSSCFLVQLEELGNPEEIFGNYAYFSSFSDSWLEHSRRFAETVCHRFRLDGNSSIIEIGSNDGYLLSFFKKAGIPTFGIEPAENVARVAREKGLETLNRFFNSTLARELVAEGRSADLLVGNNVLAHIPDTNDLVNALKQLLKPGGVISMEFPHLLSLIDQNQFDTIYHEHYSYFSLLAVSQIFEAHGLEIFDVDILETHGGSLRIYAAHQDDSTHHLSDRVTVLLEKELSRGLNNVQTYRAFGRQVEAAKRDILQFMIEAKNQGSTIVAYGAAAKGNTLLNYCGIGKDFIEFAVDRNPHKQGLFLPGSRIPIYSPERITEAKPDYLLILPWNLRTEISAQMQIIREWNGQFVTMIPGVEVW